MADTARAAERLNGEGARALPGSGPAPDESRQCANGGDLALAQRFARHATIATTVDVYGHLETEVPNLRDFVRVEGAERTRTAEVVISAVTA